LETCIKEIPISVFYVYEIMEGKIVSKFRGCSHKDLKSVVGVPLPCWYTIIIPGGKHQQWRKNKKAKLMVRPVFPAVDHFLSAVCLLSERSVSYGLKFMVEFKSILK